MADPRLLPYIQKRVAEGATRSQISQELMGAGWKPEAVAEALDEERVPFDHDGNVSGAVPPPPPAKAAAVPARSAHVTGLSGNELFCLADLGFTPGNIGVGNSVHALGVGRAIGSGFRGFAGGEITQLTELVSEGRTAALNRLEAEVAEQGASGVTGVTTEIIESGGRLEFLSVGSLLHGPSSGEPFSSSADGQELYCQIDAGYQPKKFVFGNVAYSIGAGRGITGAFRQLVRGEVPQYTEIFNHTRRLSLERIVAEAKQAGANAVVNIRAQIIPMTAGYGAQEMILIGTASHNPDLPSQYADAPVTSDLTNQEMWSMAKKGYLPLKLLMGTSVYSLGFVGGMSAFFKSFTRGEIPELTKLVYEAREKALGKIEEEAAAIGADEVVGTKFYLYELGSGLIEVLAIGTAVKRSDVAKTRSDALPAQAIVNDKDTFVDRTIGASANLSQQVPRTSSLRVITTIVTLIFVLLYFVLFIATLRH